MDRLDASTISSEDPWLAAFHDGNRDVMEQCYRDHYRTAATAVGRILADADAETVIHEVFFRLLSDRGMRESFRGGHFTAWLARVVTNGALDYRRRYSRERSSDQDDAAAREYPVTQPLQDEELGAKVLIERFRRERLPPEWDTLFVARFLRSLPQRAAAKELGIHRTTLVYREARIRALLRKFLLRTEEP